MKRFAVVQRCLHGPVAPTGIPGEVLLGARKESLPQGPGQEAKPLSAPGLAQFTNRQRTTWEKHPRLRPKSFSLPQCLCVLLLKAAARGVGGGGGALGSSPRYSTAGLLPVKERETRVSPTPPQPGAHRLVLWDPRDPPRRGSGSSGSMDAARFTQAVKLIN